MIRYSSFSPDYDSYNSLRFFSLFTFGAAIIVGSLTIQWWRYPSGQPPLCTATAIFGIITGVLQMVFAFFYGSYVLDFCTGIINWLIVLTFIFIAVVLFRNKLPGESVLPATPYFPQQYTSPPSRYPPETDKEEEDTQGLVCPECKKTFKVSEEVSKIICPYCGEKGVVE